MGEQDELFVPEKVVSYLNLLDTQVKVKSKSEIVKNEKHLSIINISDKIIRALMEEWEK